MGGPYLSEDEVSAARAHEIVAAGEAWLLDVREAYEWEEVRSPEAHLIPLSQLQDRQDELPEDRQILVICHSGARSRMVTDALVRADFPAANVAGGMIAWESVGAPIERGAGPAGAVS
ncbi:rhodanese-like domain-containing protein [Leifsonia sp. ZF2019]|uniref:rhodanese-like domain-containing protein n=1 Tax=Leifsonia sp. ZF2019 TaxID=2781978 RepID=UPI001CC1B690|nr:rhodanese-like domain-containing protein [Leifsonia sp. ZF2019]UAJ77965.1 rhodanese-like domain-containing protein [Leifsonia sp. ZF2019]